MPVPRLTALAALLALGVATAGPVAAGPNPQLALQVSHRLAFYGIDVAPQALTTPQAAALHLLMVSERGYLNVRRKARAILRNPDFRD